MPDSTRTALCGIFNVAVAAVDPARSVRDRLDLDGTRLSCGELEYDLAGGGRIVVLAFGKAAPAMVSGLADVVGANRLAGIAVGVASAVCPLPVVVGGHPEPNAASVGGGRRVLQLASNAGPDDLVVCLVSGGGSALLEVPAGNLSVDDVAATTRLLLLSGADIEAVNTVRKHLSAVKGGRLAAAASRARLLTLILSDVVGDPLDAIASGPTVPDPTTYSDALEVIERLDLRDRIPPVVLHHLSAGLSGEIPETPTEPHPRSAVRVIGSGSIAAEGAVAASNRRGLRAEIVTTTLEGEAREAALDAIAIRRPGVDVLVFAGETTVTVTGDGIGGRNQEAALAAAIAIEGTGTTFLAAGTDGIDGPTEAAGAIVEGTTTRRGAALGLDAHAYLARNDANRYLGAVGDLIITGPTGTNVADLWLVHHGSGKSTMV
jgi:glycerate 2-kinase